MNAKQLYWSSSVIHPLSNLVLGIAASRFDKDTSMLFHDSLGLVFWILNLPGTIATIWWWPNSWFLAPWGNWLFTVTIVVLSWIVWGLLGYAILCAGMRSIHRLHGPIAE